MNIALLAKWVWRFGVEKERLWCRIISEKHGAMSSHWLPGKVFNPSGISCWKIIVETSSLINTCSKFTIHSGIKVYFWFDRWNGVDSLKFSFPNLFRLAKDKFSSVISHIDNGNWVFDFNRRLLDKEVTQFASLLLRIGSSPPPLNNMPDTRRWSLGNNGVFSVKTLYYELVKLVSVSDFPPKFVWNSIIPPKVFFFVWCAVHGKLNTKDLLLRKGMTLDQECIMCGDAIETSGHLLLHCKVTYKLWLNLIPTGWCWIIPNSFLDLVQGWQQLNQSSNSLYWNLIPAAVVWVIWGERNARTFESSHTFKTDIDLIIEAKSLIISWASVFGHIIVSAGDNWDAIFS
ncbi:uncharacterized protein LOC113328545 [Papaver somniferum]|uniref:uncharacterized protein LOC113328545 n=1 Tax=Papaver somniferum TaxID=3469 RepID=UPI000E700C8C|nr:uncharacterized protein LOC113328545 [Papaver somniferum]